MMTVMTMITLITLKANYEDDDMHLDLPPPAASSSRRQLNARMLHSPPELTLPVR